MSDEPSEGRRGKNHQFITFERLWAVQAEMSSVKVKVWVQKVWCHFGHPHIKMRMTTGTEEKEQEDPGPGPDDLEHSRWNPGKGLGFSCTCMHIFHSEVSEDWPGKGKARRNDFKDTKNLNDNTMSVSTMVFSLLLVTKFLIHFTSQDSLDPNYTHFMRRPSYLVKRKWVWSGSGSKHLSAF